MKLLYFDCFSGAAGDMILGALLDAGADERFVRAQLATLALEGWTLNVEETLRSSVRATKVDVEVNKNPKPRNHSDIQALLESASLDATVKERSQAIFRALATAEARVHGTEVESVHLHEVGAIDAFVDIVGGVAALVSLAPDRVLCSALPVGGGTTSSAHGSLPVPPPAVAEILKGAPVILGGERELVTPTGAAILATMADAFDDVPPMTVESIGYGAGSAERSIPNVVRVLIGEAVDSTRTGPEALLMEANLDDMNPELLPQAIERLLAAGAYDAWVTPIVMKKGRPAFTLSALVPAQERDRALDVFYAETTTLGVRLSTVQKDELERSWIEVQVEGHTLRVKVGLRGGRATTMSPEYEEALAVARSTGLPLKDVYRLATDAAAERVDAR